MTIIELNTKGCTEILLKNCATNTYDGGGKYPAPALLDDDSKKLATCILELVKANAIDRKRIKPNYVLSMMLRGFASTDNYIVSDEFALMFFKFYTSLAIATNNTYKHGIERGKSLLVGLNDGTLTLNDFDKP